MRKRFLSVLLAVVMALGIVTPALAYTTADFSDVPPDHWAYASVMKMADAGVIKGTGNGAFSPDMTLSAEMFVTLVGRVLFPDVKAEGADWSGPYVTEAKAKGLLTGTAITDANLTGEISRYDMAVILAKSVELLKVSATKAETTKVTDYGEVPTKYADAVLLAYGSGLIQGDQNGSFNGQNSMTRQEAAAVMDRLTTLQKKASEGGNTGNTGETPDVDYRLKVSTGVTEGVLVPGERITIFFVPEPYKNAPYGLYGTAKDITCVSDDPSVAQVSRMENNWYVTAVGVGVATITVTDTYGVSGTVDVTVVPQRENIATDTYKVYVSLRNEKHTIRGNAYKETTYLYDTPFKLYYTRDGGKTAELVTEARTPAYDPNTRLESVILNLELPEDYLYSDDAGFYISAEDELDGQRIVTSDLRTDGREYISLIRPIVFDNVFYLDAKLAPPEGEKSHFPFKGKVIGGSGSVANATVQLFLENGILAGETTANADGTFEMECVVDEIDGGFDKDAKIYRLVFSRPTDSKSYSRVGLSLVKLKVAPILDEEGWGPMNFEITIFW